MVTLVGYLDFRAVEVGALRTMTTYSALHPDRIARGKTAKTMIVGAVKNSSRQARLVSTNCWPAELVQLSCLAETSRQLKLIGDWRISEVPLICTDVGLVSV